MSVTYAISGCCSNKSVQEILQEICRICAEFDWKFNNARNDGYSIEPGYYNRSSEDTCIEDAISHMKGSEFFAVTLSKQFGEYPRSARVVVQDTENGISIYVSYDDSVLSINNTEKYIFLNIMFDIIMSLDIIELFYSVSDGDMMPTVCTENGQSDFRITDVSYIPKEHIDSENLSSNSLPSSAQLVRIGEDHVLLCCERLFCTIDDRRAAAKSLGLRSI